MARVKLWRVGVLAAGPVLLLLAAGALLRQANEEGYEVRFAGRTHERAVGRAVRSLEHRLSVARYVPGFGGRRPGASDGDAATLQSGNVRIVLWPASHAELLPRAARAVEREIQRVAGGERSTAPVVLVLDRRASAPWGYSQPNYLDVPCIAVHGRRTASDVLQDTTRSVLGSCRYVAAYGRAGSAMRQWALRYGTDWVILLGPDPARGDASGRVEVDVSEASTGAYWQDSRPYMVGLSACISGATRQCEALLTTPWNSDLRADFAEWLIQRDAGVSFRRLWRYDGTIESAFVAVWGKPMAALQADWAADRFVIRHAGPLISPATAIATAISVVMAILIGAAVEGRRRGR